MLEIQDGHADAAADLLKRLLDGGQATPEIAATARELVRDVRSAGLQPNHTGRPEGRHDERPE